MNIASYKKMKDGSWGISVRGSKPRRGSPVTVTTKAGKTKIESVVWVLWSSDSGDLHLCTIEQRSAASTARRDGRCEDCEFNEDAGDMQGCARHRGNPYGSSW